MNWQRCSGSAPGYIPSVQAEGTFLKFCRQVAHASSLWNEKMRSRVSSASTWHCIGPSVSFIRTWRDLSPYEMPTCYGVLPNSKASWKTCASTTKRRSLRSQIVLKWYKPSRLWTRILKLCTCVNSRNTPLSWSSMFAKTITSFKRDGQALLSRGN